MRMLRIRFPNMILVVEPLINFDCSFKAWADELSAV